MSQFVKGSCQHCNASLEFEAHDAGRRAVCPACGMETELTASSPIVRIATKQSRYELYPKTRREILRAIAGIALMAVISYGIYTLSVEMKNEADKLDDSKELARVRKQAHIDTAREAAEESKKYREELESISRMGTNNPLTNDAGSPQ